MCKRPHVFYTLPNHTSCEKVLIEERPHTSLFFFLHKEVIVTYQKRVSLLYVLLRLLFFKEMKWCFMTTEYSLKIPGFIYERGLSYFPI